MTILSDQIDIALAVEYEQKETKRTAIPIGLGPPPRRPGQAAACRHSNSRLRQHDAALSGPVAGHSRADGGNARSNPKRSIHFADAIG